MKLYLSSYRIPNPEALFSLVGKKPSDIKVAIIPNAKDYYSDYVKGIKLTALLADLKAIGLTSSETVDLNHFSVQNTADLQRRLAPFNLIWVNGGNTFCLRYAMRGSGFDAVIHNVLKAGVVYGGESAGAIVAGDTIKGAELADEPTFTPKIIYDGLNLVGDYIVPHTDSPDYSEIMVEVQKVQKDHPSIISLKDSEAYIVDGENRRIVSSKV